MDKYKFNDVTKKVLNNLESDGSDMTKPMFFDFEFDCDNEEDCINFKSIINFSISNFYYSYDVQDEIWTCSLKILIIPKHESIIEIEEKLINLCQVSGARYTGFGSFGNAANKAH